MRTRVASVAALSALLLSACSGGPRWTGTVRDSAGIAIVENTLEGMWTTSNQWTLAEELKIGQLEGDPDYMFGQIGYIAVDSRGRMFVIDMQAREIKVYSAEGEYEQTIGRPGSGPGELGLNAAAIFMGPGDTLLVADMGNQRVNRYAPDGSSLGSFRLALENGIPMAINATRSGVIAEQVRPLALPDQPVRDSMDAILVLGTDGTVLDTLKRFESGATLNLGGSAPEINLFSPEPVWQLTGDMHLCFGLNSEYSIGIHAPDGTLERIIRMPFERSLVAERDQGMIMGTLEELWQEAGVPPAAIAQLRTAIHFGEFYPAFASIQAGPLGTLWIQHIQSPSGLSEEELQSWNMLEDIGARDWDVFDSEGRFQGVVTMPPRFAPRIIVDNKIYGVWRDEYDVQYATRLRIVGVPGGDTGEIELGVGQ